MYTIPVIQFTLYSVNYTKNTQDSIEWTLYYCYNVQSTVYTILVYSPHSSSFSHTDGCHAISNVIFQTLLARADKL